MRRLALAIVALFLLAACAPAISRPSLDLVDPTLAFEDVLQNPDAHRGRFLLLGGAIAAIRAADTEGSELEIVQLPTNRRGRILSTDQSLGRFIAQDTRFRDPALYPPGRLVTLVGEVTGSRSGRIGERDYLFPVVQVQELHLWPPGAHPDVPRTRFGIGVGIGIGL
ncbi:Slp family lipoprotein [Geoalkalibacter halelectricus]|uniref:Slp family lipoprotein n=2 Tax=Geoalkalibacter halelectricus TaxID=2847045 RepID=A0ABY5ZIE4_9BACT|nr:Slp family lipoprotein [Geoalkalibacter halelectricus]MDO3380205.1 Slp family lipoprotein [Geoalkalibacter halelectricus]UWZ78224.1 Slp family lipoprotein [Geoalkalibacter halelectricus]